MLSSLCFSHKDSALSGIKIKLPLDENTLEKCSKVSFDKLHTNHEALIKFSLNRVKGEWKTDCNKMDILPLETDSVIYH